MSLLAAPLTPEQKVAFVMSPRLGDCLLSMIVVHNLARYGIKVEVLSEHLYALRQWFPWATIHPLLPEEERKKILANCEMLIHAYASDVICNSRQWHPCVVVLDESPVYRQCIPMVDIQVATCREALYLPQAERTNGLVVPQGFVYRRFPKRVVIHPTSSQPHKDWLPQRFLQLAQALQRRGYQPEFIVSPTERPAWEWLLRAGFALPQLASLHEVAGWIYESGWMVGNDSGIGHLASNLGIPTVTLGRRVRGLARWRPAWAPGAVVQAPSWLSWALMTGVLKRRFWKYFITVNQVQRAFEQLVASERGG